MRAQSPRLCTHADAPVDGALLGGKAARLAELGRAGLPVPPWLCLTTAVHAEVIAGLEEEIATTLAALDVDDGTAVREASRRLGAAVRARALPEADRRALAERVAALFPAGARVAVRSSVVGEDGAKDSFAGQMDTYLHVRAGEIVERVLDCFASAFGERALVYRRLRGAAGEVHAAVLVQLMVDARAAGVVFTANPQSGARDEAVIAAGLGLGEGVVAGTVDTDTWFCELASGAVLHAAIAEKRSRVVLDAARGSGTRIDEVPPEQGDRPCLDEAQLRALCALARQVEAQADGAPQDLEFAFDAAGKLWLLQARPITTLGRGRESIFDNANIVESYPGLVQPLTFSFARAGYEQIFRENTRRMGASDALLARNADIYPNLIALIEGRAYYNILSWYRIFQQLPGFEWALPAWEKALGLKRLSRPRRRSAGEKLAAAPTVARAWGRILVGFFRLERNVERFLELMRAAQAEEASAPLADLDAHALLDRIDHLLGRLMPEYSMSPFNDSWAQQLHEAVGRAIDRWKLGDPVALRNGLLCGEEGMESVAPVRSMLALTEKARRSARLRELLESDASGAAVWAAIRSEAALADFRGALDEHLRSYGDRMVHELKLETPPVEEDPAFVVEMLRNYLAGGQESAEMQAREQRLRDEAEAAVRRGLRLRPLRRGLFWWLLRRLRASVRDRENLRFARTRAVGMARRIYRELGRRFVAARLLDDDRDVFWLTTDEVAAVVRGQSVTADLRALIELRKRDYAGFAASRPDSRITTHGIVYADDLRGGGAATAVAPGGTALRGLGASPGRVEAPGKVLTDPRSDARVRGEILVAPTTDPGWVFLMVAAGGLVAEKGSLLSHTAIVGRELGIPTVVGVKDATRLIPNGARLLLDGAAGTVTVLDEGAD